VAVPAKRVPFFKPSKELRDLVNPGEAATRTQKAGHDPGGSGGPGGEGNLDPHHPPPM
jgi:integration host factor subunit beta